MLKVAVINHTYDKFMFSADPELRFSATYLIDEANQKKYFIVHDAEGNPSCSGIFSEAAPNSQTILWAEFPLPPDDVQKINIVVPTFQPMEDVPIGH